MKLYQIDPITDRRWQELIARHPSASVFHTVSWLQVLRRTYGYEPVVFTTSPPEGELKNGLVFCRIDSWLTGRRIVSLPFSDHCQHLCDSTEDLNFLLHSLRTAAEQEKWRYLELRPVDANFDERDPSVGLRPSATFFLHTLDLRPDLNQLYRSLDKDCIQRRIRRAERADLVEKSGVSENLLEHFYRLFLMTRGRHRIPPIPHSWFRNLMRYLGDAMDIRVAYKGEAPIAAILTLRHRDITYYKYGCSDARFNNYAATPWLFWRSILSAKTKGATQFDFGRTELNNPGLLAFKNHWVPNPKKLVYWRYPQASTRTTAGHWKWSLAKSVFSLLPEKLQASVGELLYPHIG